MVRGYDELHRYAGIFEQMSPANMSGDEQEPGDNLHVYRRHFVEWRSEEFQAFLEGLDSIYFRKRQIPIGPSLGTKPRTRLPPKGKVENAPAPPGLPRNCYRPSWLKKLGKFALYKLDIVDKELPLVIPDDI